MKKIHAVAFILGFMTFSASTQVAYAANPDKVPGNYINVSALGVSMQAAELHLSGQGYFVSTDGKLYGHNTFDQDAGRPKQSDTAVFQYLHNIHDYIPLLDGETIRDIELSQNSRFVVTDSGKVLAGGYNLAGQLGNNSTIGNADDKLQDVTSYFPDLGESKVIQIAHTGFSTFALTDDGRIFGYGSNFILGDNTSMRNVNIGNGKVLTPLEITDFAVDYDPTNDPIITISLGAALTESGILYAWGNYYSSTLVPTSVFDNSLLSNGDYLVDVETIGNGMMVLSNEGRVFAIGNNQSYNLGFDNPNSMLNTFTELTVPNLTNGDKIVYMSYGFLISNEGRVYTWGDNQYGKAAIPGNTNNSVPLTDVTENVVVHLGEDEQFVYGFKANNPNNGTASVLITNLGQAVAYGARSAFGYPNDGFNAPFTEGITANPEKVTYTLDSLGGPDLGSYYWPKTYRVYYNNMFPTPFNSMASLLIVPNYTFGGYFIDEELTNPLPQFDVTYAENDMTIYVKWVNTGGSSSQSGSSIPTSIPGSSSLTPGRPVNVGGIVLVLATVSAGGGAYFWFGVQKKTFQDLVQWFLILIGRKNKKDKEDKPNKK